MEGEREGAKAKREVRYKIQSMCSAKAFCVDTEIDISKAQLTPFV